MASAILAGQRFGLLTVINRAENNIRGHKQWQCICDCGVSKVVVTSSLNNGRVQSCGCLLNPKGEKSQNWKGGKIEVQCANPKCDKTKLIYPARMEIYEKFYCSTGCRTAVKGWNKRPSNNVTVECAHCGKSLEIWHCLSLTYKNHFCKGTDCKAKWMEENQKGSLNPNWKDGISYEPYPAIFVDKRFKAGIKERDNFTCQNPECPKTDSVLVIHHINYQKSDCEPTNLITLCNNCNSKANANRDFWQAGYSEIIRLKYESVHADRQIAV